MAVYFGTDGIRGVAMQDLNFDIAYKCGNSLAQIMNAKGKVIIGRDTRLTGSYILNSISSGLMAGGIDVYDVGVIPTAGVAFLTKLLKFDYGIVITASHNPREYNGIKILAQSGEKIQDSEEEKIEKCFIKHMNVHSDKVGRVYHCSHLKKHYINHLLSTVSTKLNGFKIVIDASNGASYSIAPYIFKKLGANVLTINSRNKGDKINYNCGALYPNALKNKVLKTNADMGFAFDGDADRIIAIDNNGNLIDGDVIVYALSKAYKEKNMLLNNIVVGTSQTNMGIEHNLLKSNIKLLRADVGDKYVIELMNKSGACLGGEQSGHIIISNYMPTGDGILAALQLSCFCKEKQISLSEFCSVELYPQANINVCVKEKFRVLGNEKLVNTITNVQQELAGNGRVLVRASGTESKIRIMVECGNQDVANNLAQYIADIAITLENDKE